MRKKGPGLFHGFWLDMAGRKLRRIYHSEYGELYRLWAKHKDIREGRHSG